MENNVELDNFVVVQRQNFVKIHKLGSKNLECRLGQDTVDLSTVVGQPFWSTYKMELKTRNKRFYILSKCQFSETFSEKIMNITESGVDNRNINDDGSSQKLSTVDIMNLKESGISAEAIVERLIENSKTFSSKTEYSQEKYLKKKEKKYLDQIIIKKPTFRIIAEYIIGKGPGKTLGLRMDSLAQITTLASVRSGGTYMVYETGCQGLVSAAVLNSLGCNGRIFHVHSGNNPEKQAVSYLNLPQSRLDQIMCLNILSINKNLNELSVEMKESEDLMPDTLNDSVDSTVDDEPEKKRPRWEVKEEKIVEELKECDVDGLIIVGKEHPTTIICHLLRYLHPSRSFVVFCAMREPLQELFLELRSRSDVTALRLTESWLRSYQVQPDRTHPDINMSGSSGFLLSGIKVAC